MSDCIFCKIINGDIPSAKVFENDDVLAFLDISQITKGHTLVIPKKHQENIYELESETAAKLFEVVPTIAKAIKAEFKPQALNILNNNGVFAGQTVFHYHLHLIPRYDENDGFQYSFINNTDQYTGDDLQNIAQAIHRHIES